MLKKVIVSSCISIALIGCGVLTPSNLAGTASALGCWPYGYIQPDATATYPPTLTPINTIIPSVVVPSITPIPTWTTCTPAPNIPTLTPSQTPTLTPWVRPTNAPPIIGDTPPRNISNLPGYDVDPVVAVHPTEGWAAVAWGNWLESDPDNSTVFVKVQGDNSVWNAAIGINTEPVKKGGNPAIAIDKMGNIHVVYGAGDGMPRYSFSNDRGRSWSNSQIVVMPSNANGVYFPQLWVDASNILHLLYSTSGCFDCYRYVHASKQGGVWVTQDRLVEGSKQLFGDGTSIQLPNGTTRTIAAIGCRSGCSFGSGVSIAIFDGIWREVSPIPNQNKRVDQVIQWIDIISFLHNGQQFVCVSWGQYSKSALHNSCSTDYGETWSETEVVAYHSATTANPIQPTSSIPTATIDPSSGSDGSSTSLSKRGYHPELIYIPQGRLAIVWSFMETDRTGNPSTLVYSYRDLDSDTWNPFIDAANDEPAPPLRLFQSTRRNAARNPRIATRFDGLAVVTWVEVERDESIEVYFGTFNPVALIAKEK